MKSLQQYYRAGAARSRECPALTDDSTAATNLYVSGFVDFCLSAGLYIHCCVAKEREEVTRQQHDCNEHEPTEGNLLVCSGQRPS